MPSTFWRPTGAQLVSAWQELAPDLAAHPLQLQLDLLSPRPSWIYPAIPHRWMYRSPQKSQPRFLRMNTASSASVFCVRIRAQKTLCLKATLVGMLAGTVSSSPIDPCGLWNSTLQNSSLPPNLAFLRNMALTAFSAFFPARSSIFRSRLIQTLPSSLHQTTPLTSPRFLESFLAAHRPPPRQSGSRNRPKTFVFKGFPRSLDIEHPRERGGAG
jgi:hypothetical protein